MIIISAVSNENTIQKSTSEEHVAGFDIDPSAQNSIEWPGIEYVT